MSPLIEISDLLSNAEAAAIPRRALKMISYVSGNSRTAQLERTYKAAVDIKVSVNQREDKIIESNPTSKTNRINRACTHRKSAPFYFVW